LIDYSKDNIIVIANGHLGLVKIDHPGTFSFRLVPEIGWAQIIDWLCGLGR